MFNFILMKIGQLFFKSPAIHTKPPKMIVMNFANAISSEPLILSLENITSVKFNVQLDSIPNTNVSNPTVLYNIVATVDKNNNETKTIKLISFENKKDADNALELLIYKLYSPLKRFYQTVLTIIFIILLAIFSKDLLTSTLHGYAVAYPAPSSNIQNSNTKNNISNNQNPSSTGNIDINNLPAGVDPNLIAQAQKIIEDQNKKTGNIEQPTPIDIPTPNSNINVPPNVGTIPSSDPPEQLIQQPQTPADAFINNLNN